MDVALPQMTDEPVADDAFVKRLTDAIRGEARFDALARTLHATDASIYEILPLGVVCPDASTNGLIDSIERVVSDRPGSQRLARGGLEFVREHHSISAMAEQFAGLYRRLVLARATIKMPE